MNKLLFIIILMGSLTASSKGISAQSVNCAPVASSQKSDDGAIVAYPNPARDFIVVKSKDSAVNIKSVAFYSILGVQVAELAVNNNSGEFKLDRLRPGKYLMRYTMSDNTQKVAQIVKQ